MWYSEYWLILVNSQSQTWSPIHLVVVCDLLHNQTWGFLYFRKWEIEPPRDNLSPVSNKNDSCKVDRKINSLVCFNCCLFTNLNPIFTILNPKKLLYKLDTLNLFTFACVAALGSRFFVRLPIRACGSRCIARCNVIVNFLIFENYMVQCLNGIVVASLKVWLKCQIAIKFLVTFQPTIRLFFLVLLHANLFVLDRINFLLTFLRFKQRCVNQMWYSKSLMSK